MRAKQTDYDIHCQIGLSAAKDHRLLLSLSIKCVPSTRTPSSSSLSLLSILLYVIRQTSTSIPDPFGSSAIGMGNQLAVNYR